MRLHLAFAALLLLQTSPETTPDPAHLRFERQLTLPDSTRAQACAVLDATIYAHAAEASVRDLRLFATTSASSSGSAPANTEREVPYAISESDTQEVETESVPAQHIVVSGNKLDFDLAMPHRPYSAVELRLSRQEFVGVARVTSQNPDGTTAADLGGFVLFDLTSRQLPRSTTLSLAETTSPTLHVTLRMFTPDGRPLPHVDPGMIAGAVVPPSREAQVLYTIVAQSTSLLQLTPDTIALFPPVPTHVPVERISVLLRPGEALNFARTVSVTSRPFPQPTAPQSATTGDVAWSETLSGEIGRVFLPGAALAPPLRYEQLHLPATLGVSLSTPAEVQVAIHNQGADRLPVAAVLLEMRRRSLCFDAIPGEQYTLRYGDAALPAPSYDYARGFTPAAHTQAAELGPEQPNPRFVPRSASHHYANQHPEALSVGLLILVAAAGLAGLESVKRRRDR